MRIHVLSDLHNEFEVYQPEEIDADVVVLAGDIDIKGRAIAWAKEAFSVPVLYVPGNHEFYKGHFEKTLKKMRDASDDQVHVLDRDAVVINGVRFLGAIMWTDFCSTGNPPLATYMAKEKMNDFRYIRTQDYRRLTPSDMVSEAIKTRAWLMEQLEKPFDGPTVVVTHHAPTLRSLQDDPRSGSHLDAAYANRWEDLMDGKRVALWIHGHTHFSVDYEVYGTRVISNPRGYPDEDTGFDPLLTVTLG